MKGYNTIEACFVHSALCCLLSAPFVRTSFHFGVVTALGAHWTGRIQNASFIFVLPCPARCPEHHHNSKYYIKLVTCQCIRLDSL